MSTERRCREDPSDVCFLFSVSLEDKQSVSWFFFILGVLLLFFFLNALTYIYCMDHTRYVTLQALKLYLLTLQIVKSFCLLSFFQSPVRVTLIRTDSVAMKPCCGTATFIVWYNKIYSLWTITRYMKTKTCKNACSNVANNYVWECLYVGS